MAHKDDEITLFNRVRHECFNRYPGHENDGPAPIVVARELDIPYKRAEFLFEKWADKGIYEYGVAAPYGWITPKGFEEGLI